MSAEEWAEVFDAGWRAIPGRTEEAANALAIALHAMSKKCEDIAIRRRGDDE